MTNNRNSTYRLIGIKTVAVASALTITACAKATHEIPPSYVSPIQYGHYDCAQIQREMTVLSRRVADVGGHVDKAATNDKVKMGVGLVLLWPTLFFIEGDSPQAQEYARLKGEFEALEKAAIQKNCDINVEVPKPVTEDRPTRQAHPYGNQVPRTQ